MTMHKARGAKHTGSRSGSPVRRALRRLWAASLLIGLALLSPGSAGADNLVKVRVGVLKFGTVNWELDVIKHRGLDRKEGVELEVVGLGSKLATAVALQGGTVDVIVTDWLWVSRQRTEGTDHTFVPHSLATGGLTVRPDAGITKLDDLRGKRVGIAGGPVDKSWLLLRAYSKKTTGIDLKDVTEPTFAAPPLLNQIILKGDLPAGLNFWHYGARLKVAGMRELVSVADMLPVLGIDHTPPLLGWVFSESWAEANGTAIRGFLRASLAAKKIMATSDEEWDRLRPRTKAEDDATFLALRKAYRAGIPASFAAKDVTAATALFETLAELGGAKLIGHGKTLAPGTFWNGFSF